MNALIRTERIDIRLRTTGLKALLGELAGLGEQRRRAPDGGATGNSRRHPHRSDAHDVPQTRRSKIVVAPDGAPAWAPQAAHVDSTLVKALARAFRWRKLLETGTHATVTEIAAAEKINASYISRLLRLTLLAPDIVEAILGGRKPANLQLEDLLRRFPVEWQAQGDGFADRVAVNDG